MKLYPFSAKNHAHDIDLVANRSFNLAQDSLQLNNYSEYDRLMDIHEQANDVLSAIQDGMRGFSGVSMLTGEMIGKAKEYVLLADEIRSGLNMQYT